MLYTACMRKPYLPIALLFLAGVLYAEAPQPQTVHPPTAEEMAQLSEPLQQYVKLGRQYHELGGRIYRKFNEAKDRATADAAAKELEPMVKEAERLNEAVFRLCIDNGVRMEESGDVCFRYVVSREESERDVRNIAALFDRFKEADFYGSEALKGVMESFLHVLTLATDSPNPMLLRLYGHTVSHIESNGRNVSALLEGVEDLTTADSAAPLLRQACGEKRKYERGFMLLHMLLARDLYTNWNAVSLHEDCLKTLIEQMRQENARRRALASLAEPYYGSKALQEAMEATAPQSVLEGKKLELAEKAGRMSDILRGISDKESADAAAPLLSDILKETEATDEAEIDLYTISLGHDNLHRAEELMEMDPPCYGSKALMDFILSKATP